ncbi:SusC/RagA family TonB-linked outer membrane protein [Olivibacter domesticus]|uniref:TonB-linked outer membrane protein, SusC/RagA family n=1 Tax=Olivibacter domesticus TaxID=407022 RepID=A0A1H7QGT3_OLID1|nr:TonB-dependent receptor [Olivibacter domesticus]SEL47146.1 TonB-linked outer membrane protein, SusC/RagA family [Olivibacter domesticus]
MSTKWLKTKILISLLATYPCLGQLSAQILRIQGKVIDEKQQPLIGVSIKDTLNKTGTTTDSNGNFMLSTSKTAHLIFSLVGYLNQTREIGNQPSLTVTLKEDISTLDEVVVIGYGTMKKSSVTAAVTKLENKNLDQIPLARPEAALQGRLAGVNVSQTRSAPGSAPLIRIRGGSGSIDAGNSPLVVVDGFPGGSFSNVNMNDVASIEVLKDASSAAIYGSRGAGGVIIITTKRGKTGKPLLNININGGFANAIGHNDWLGKDEYYEYAVKYQNREYNYVGGDTSIPVWGDNRRPPQYQVSDALRNNANTNWQNALLSAAPFQNYDLSVSGGTENVKYYASAIVKDVQGTLKNTWFKSYGARANVDVKVNKSINLGLMLNPNYTRNRVSPHAMIDLVKYPPFVPVQNADGTYPKARDFWGLVVSGQTNPMAFLDGSFYFDDAMTTIGEMFASIDLAKGLKIRSSVGTTIAYSTSDRFRTTWGSTNGISTGTASDARTINLLNENVLSYTTDFNDNHFDAILGASYQKATSRSSAMGAVPGSFNNDIIHTLNNAIIDPAQTRTSKTEWGLVSYFSRIHYAYKDKYILSASMRTDASSRFGPDNKWGWFPSASVAWRVSQEEFMKSLSSISDLKLRASYGSTGNFNIGNFDFLGQIGNTYYSPNNELANAQVQTTLGNPSLSWEKTHEYDLGLDLGLFQNRLTFTADYYRKNTSSLLYNVSIPAITGFTSWLTNIGEIRNEGIELELTSQNLKGPLTWTTSFNLARNRNKVVDLGGLTERLYTDRFGMSWLLRLGEPMFSYYGYNAIGVLQNQEEVNNTPILSGSKPGNPKYEDVNGDKRITPEDRVILGNYMPKMILGMVNDFSWKNFDLSIAIQASLGAKMYNFENQYYQGNVLGAMRRSLVEGQWWSENDPGDGKMPASALSQLEFQGNSSVYIENASFLAVRNLNFGYTLPEHLANKLKMKRCRFYTSINNLFMITDKNFHGYNPEGYTAGEVDGINSTPGYNSGSEPMNRIFTLGLNVNF